MDFMKMLLFASIWIDLGTRKNADPDLMGVKEKMKLQIPKFFRTLTKSYFFPYIILIMLPVLVYRYLHTYLSTVTYVEVLRGRSLDHCEDSINVSSWSPPSMHPSCCPWPLMTGMLQKSPILVFIEKYRL
jgi:hypothetical protein